MAFVGILSQMKLHSGPLTILSLPGGCIIHNLNPAFLCHTASHQENNAPSLFLVIPVLFTTKSHFCSCAISGQLWSKKQRDCGQLILGSRAIFIQFWFLNRPSHKFKLLWIHAYKKMSIYIPLTNEFEGRTISYGPSFFLLDLWPKREARRP